MTRPSLWRLFAIQVRIDLRMFFRSPLQAFFSLIFPLLMLLVFATLFGHDRIGLLNVTAAQFYAPALAVYGAISTVYWNLAISVVAARELGVLKRIRGSPLPPAIYMAGRLAASALTAMLAVVIMMTVGVLAYGVQVYAQTLPAALLTFVVGCACFAALGMVIASISPNANTTPVLTSATLLPLSFISEVFIPPSPSAPAWLGHFADIFPIKHFARAFAGAFNPSLHGNGFTWSDTDGAYAVLPHLAVLSVWGIAALLFAVRHFSWEPRPEKGR